MTERTSLSLSLGIEAEYWPIRIVVSDEDNDRSTPVQYAPTILVAEDYDLLPELLDAAWARFDEQIKNSQEFGYESVPVYLEDDEGKPSELETDELTLVRYGRQIVRVYGPRRVRRVNKYGEERIVDLVADMKLTVLNNLNKSLSDIESDAGYEGRKMSSRSGMTTDLFDEVPGAGDGTKRLGRFNQQQADDEVAELISYEIKGNLGGHEFARHFVLPGNRGDWGGEQVQRNGRREQIIREVLTFNGDTEKRIEYWYEHGNINILHWTKFVDIDGEPLRKPSNIMPNDEDDPPPAFEYNNLGDSKRGPVFYAESPCWGSMIVEYATSYEEYQILYDFPAPRRQFDVFPGPVERIGYLVKNQDGESVLRGDYLHGSSFTPDRVEQDPKTGFKYALKLFKKISIKPFKIFPITIIATNGRQVTTHNFSPPPPEFNDLAPNELPKVAIFEERVRSRVYPDGAATGANYLEVENVEEATYIDVMGNSSTWQLEKRTQES